MRAMSNTAGERPLHERSRTELLAGLHSGTERKLWVAVAGAAVAAALAWLVHPAFLVLTVLALIAAGVLASDLSGYRRAGGDR